MGEAWRGLIRSSMGKIFVQSEVAKKELAGQHRMQSLSWEAGSLADCPPTRSASESEAHCRSQGLHAFSKWIESVRRTLIYLPSEPRNSTPT